MDKSNRHRVGRGNPSPRLDPYVIEETTVTLAEWRRLAASQRAREATPKKRARPRAA
jgi:hypothetical protein